MKTHILAAILGGVALITSLLAFGYCGYYVVSARAAMRTEGEFTRLNAISTAVRALLLDSLEYSKTHPSMTPLLQTWNIVARGPQATNPVPPLGIAPKTSTR
ncbi:MAG: hypothetical protein HZA90_07700 [Verrucomicrobia bacterium]|nr:hypothetical protein [Verrucomicrobiota bacterium]